MGSSKQARSGPGRQGSKGEGSPRTKHLTSSDNEILAYASSKIQTFMQ